MIDARTLTVNNSVELALWCGGLRIMQFDALDDSKPAIPAVNVPTDNGVQRAHIGDTIIQNPDGSFQIQKRTE